MDAIEIEPIVQDCEICVGVMGRGKDFVLFPLLPPVGIDVEAEARKARSLGFLFCGVLGLNHGQPAVQCEPGLEVIYPMMLAALAFAQQYAHHILPVPKGDSAEWLQQLYNMRDTRPN